MSEKSWISVTALAGVTGLAVSAASAQVNIPTVRIGNPGNAPDPGSAGLYGSVAYTYNIGRTEVTNAQYAAFLNAVAATDPNSLYSTNMAGSFGGITRSGSAGSYTYSPVGGRENNPVNFVSFWDTCRFANWLHNGQPTGPQSNATTESGAYTLTFTGTTNNTITRNAGWQWAVTSENEWYKAAYHQPASLGGDSDNYWLYPTRSNSINASQANFDLSGINNTTPAGSYAENFYGTYDMGGNVWERNETIVVSNSRGLRGGGFSSSHLSMWASLRADSAPWDESSSAIGFRVVQVPGPSSVALLAIGGVGALAPRRRRGAGR